MDFDAAVALRMLTNNRLRGAQGWCEFRDLGGALCSTSDAPIPELNALGDFHTDELRIEGILDIGFSLLRVFDCPAAAETTPLDRPASVARWLQRRGLVEHSRRTWMAFSADPRAIRTNPEVEIRIASHDDVPAFAQIHGGSDRWLRKVSQQTTLTAMHDGGSTFYLAYLEGQPVGTAHVLLDGATAGIYAVGTLRAFRRRGVCSTLMARAIADARASGCDVICLSTATGGDAERLYTRLGFEPLFESTVWVMPDRPPEPVAAKKRRRRAARA